MAADKTGVDLAFRPSYRGTVENDLSLMTNNYGSDHVAHYAAADHYAAAEDALHALTGKYITALVGEYGSLAAVAAAFPEIAPGLSGLPYDSEA
jgi:hypothetical protein